MHYRKKVELSLGRKLTRRDHVHHIDGDHSNNRLSNLRVLSPTHHSRIHNGWVERNGELTKLCRECGASIEPNPKSPAICTPCKKKQRAKYQMLHIKIPVGAYRSVGGRKIEQIKDEAKDKILALAAKKLSKKKRESSASNANNPKN